MASSKSSAKEIQVKKSLKSAGPGRGVKKLRNKKTGKTASNAAGDVEGVVQSQDDSAIGAMAVEVTGVNERPKEDTVVNNIQLQQIHVSDINDIAYQGAQFDDNLGSINNSTASQYYFVSTEDLIVDIEQDALGSLEQSEYAFQATLHDDYVSQYPPLPTLSEEDVPDRAIGFADEDDEFDFGLTQNPLDDGQANHNAAQLIAFAAQAALDQSNSSTTLASPVLFRPVLPIPNATQKVTAEKQKYENDVRRIEGDYLSTLHSRLIIETGLNSFRARKLVNGREQAAFDHIYNDLLARIPSIAGSWFLAHDKASDPIRIRLYNLHFTALVAQYGDSWDFVQATQPTSLTDECVLEARNWTSEKLVQLDTENRQWLVDNAHLMTHKQSHLELSSGSGKRL